MAELETSGWDVHLDWQDEAREPRGPEWLRRVVGDDYFQKVVGVDASKMDAMRMLESIRLLKRLPDLRYVGCYGDIPERAFKILVA